MQQDEKANKYKQTIKEELKKHFKNGELRGSFTIEVSTDIPYLMLDMRTIVYEFFVLNISIEQFGISFSVSNKGFPLDVYSGDLDELDKINSEMMQKVDDQIRLRIPDKYLEAKGWL